MRLSCLVVGLSLAAALPAMAALPPQYQRQAELVAIITDAAVTEAMGINGIDAVQYVDTDHYQLRSGTCVLEVRIETLPKAQPDSMVGARQFGVVLPQPEPSCQ